LLVAVAVGVTLVGALPLAAGLLAGPALAAICRPVHRRLGKRIGVQGAAIVTVALVWVLLVIPAVWLAMLAVRRARAAASDIQATAERLRDLRLPFTDIRADTIVAKLGATTLGSLAGSARLALEGVAHIAVELSIALLTLYYLLIDGERVWNEAR